MKKNKRLAVTILISGAGVFISYLITLILTSYITDEIGIEAYGFVSIAKSFTSYAGIITIALTTFIIRFITIEYHKGHTERANGYYSSSVAACYSISIAILLIAMVGIFFLEYLLVIPDSIIPSVKFLFFWIFLQFCTQTVTTPYSAAAYIKDRLDLVGIAKIVSYLVEAAVLIVLFRLLSPSVWFVGFGAFMASIVLAVYNRYLIKKYTPELHFDVGVVKFRYVADVISKGVWTSLNSLGNVLNSGLDLIISNRMLSAIQTGQISVIKSFDSIFSILYVTVFQPFQPQLMQSYASGDIDRYIKETQKAMGICGFFSNIAFAGFLALGRLYFRLWLPNQDYEYLYLLAVVSVMGSLMAGVSQPIYYVNTLTLKNKLPCWITIISGFINVFSMWFLLKYTHLGPIAVVGTTSVLMFFINLVFNPLYSAKCIGVSPKVFYKVIVRHLGSAVIMVLACKGIADVMNPDNWIELLVSAAVMVVAALCIHMTVMFGPKAVVNIVKSKVKQKI